MVLQDDVIPFLEGKSFGAIEDARGGIGAVFAREEGKRVLEGIVVEENGVAVAHHLYILGAGGGSEGVDVNPEGDGVLVVVDGFFGAGLDAEVGKGGVGGEEGFRFEGGGGGDELVAALGGEVAHHARAEISVGEEGSADECEDAEKEFAVFGGGGFVQHCADGSETAGSTASKKSGGASKERDGHHEETRKVENGVANEAREGMVADNAAEVEDFKEDAGEGEKECPLKSVGEPLEGIALHAVLGGEVEHGREGGDAEKEEAEGGGGAEPLLLDGVGLADAIVCEVLEFVDDKDGEGGEDGEENEEDRGGGVSALLEEDGEVDAERDEQDEEKVGEAAFSECLLDDRGVNAFLWRCGAGASGRTEQSHCRCR